MHNQTSTRLTGPHGLCLENKFEYRIIESDYSQGSIRIPIETDLQFQRAFSASFGTLPMRLVLKAVHELLRIDGHVIHPNLIEWVLKMLLDIVETDQNKGE